MKTLNVSAEIEGLVLGPSSLFEVVAALRRMKEDGVERATALQTLESLRERTVDEETDDRILEVIDFVTGFCSPHMTIWD